MSTTESESNGPSELGGKKSLTLVTCLYDLKSKGNATSRKMDFYFQHGEWILSLDQYLVIWCDPHLAGKVWEQREKHGLTNKTSVIGVPLESFKYYQQIMGKSKILKKTQGIDNDEWSYIAMTCARLNMIEHTINLNPFNSSHYAWIDFGLFYVAQVKYINTLHQICNDFPSKFRIMMVCDIAPSEVKDRSGYYSLFKHKLAGGLYIAPVEIMRLFLKAFELELGIMFKSGWCSLVETIFGAIYIQHQDWFDVYYGDYENIIGSYFICQSRTGTLFKNMVHCRLNGLHQTTFKISQQMEEAHQRKALVLKPDEIFCIYDEMLIAAFYISKREIAIYAGKQLVTLAKKHPKELASRITNPRMLSNLSSIGLSPD